MIKLEDILLEKVDKHKHKDKPNGTGQVDTTAYQNPYADSSKSKKKKVIEIIKKMKRLADKGIYSFGNFPEWILASWANPDGNRAIPLKNNLWLDTRIAESADSESDEVYAGYIVDSTRVRVKGTTSISIQKSPIVDKKKLKKLKLYASLMKVVQLAKEREIKKKKLASELQSQQAMNTTGQPQQAGMGMAPSMGGAMQPPQQQAGGGLFGP